MLCGDGGGRSPFSESRAMSQTVLPQKFGPAHGRVRATGREDGRRAHACGCAAAAAGVITFSLFIQ